MKAIQIILLSGAYASTIPFGVGVILNHFSTHLRTPYQLELILGGLGLCLLPGYSRSLAGHQPWDAPKFFWTTSLAFNLLGLFAAVRLHHLSSLTTQLTSRLTQLSEGFHPIPDPERILGGVAGMGLVFAACWMPFAALLSLIALMLTWRNQPKAGAVLPAST